MTEPEFNKLTEQKKSPKVSNNLENHINKSKLKKYKELKLPPQFYENLFANEMEFKEKPKKELIPKIIEKYCLAVEYFSSKGDDLRTDKFKFLLNIFLFDSNVLSLLNDDETLANPVKKNLKNELIIKNIEKQLEQNFDSNSKIYKLNQFNDENDFKIKQKIHNGNTEMKRKNTMDILLNEIEIQQNNFKKKLFLKKILKNKNKKISKEQIKRSIQNTTIISRINENKENENQNKSSISQISPIKTKENSNSNFNKVNISNEEISSFLDSAKNNINLKDTPSPFEPFTPDNSTKNDNSENNKKNKNETVHDFNDNFELNFDLNEKNISVKNLSQKNEILNHSNNIESIETGNATINSFSTTLNSLSNSLNKNQIYNLDYQNIFETIDSCKTLGIKQQRCFNDIKNLISNYIKDFNNYFYDELFIKFLLQISNIIDKKYENFVEVYEYYNNQIKDIENKLFDLEDNSAQIKEFCALIEILKNELDNEVGKIDSNYNNKINDLVIDFKNNYNKNDAGIKLMEEKFKFNICNKLSEILSCGKK